MRSGIESATLLFSSANGTLGSYTLLADYDLVTACWSGVGMYAKNCFFEGQGTKVYDLNDQTGASAYANCKAGDRFYSTGAVYAQIYGIML